MTLCCCIKLENFKVISFYFEKLIYSFLILLSEKKESPKFTKKLDTLEALETETVRLEVIVTGRPKPQVTW